MCICNVVGRWIDKNIHKTQGKNSDLWQNKQSVKLKYPIVPQQFLEFLLLKIIFLEHFIDNYFLGNIAPCG